jgi:hypothetical protein
MLEYYQEIEYISVRISQEWDISNVIYEWIIF